MRKTLKILTHPTPFSIAVVKFGFWLAIVVLILGHVVGTQILGV